MKPILALLLVAGFLVGMVFLVISTTQYMHERNAPPVVPSGNLTTAGGDALADPNPPDADSDRILQEKQDRMRAQIADNRGRHGM